MATLYFEFDNAVTYGAAQPDVFLTPHCKEERAVLNFLESIGYRVQKPSSFRLMDNAHYITNFSEVSGDIYNKVEQIQNFCLLIGLDFKLASNFKQEYLRYYPREG